MDLHCARCKTLLERRFSRSFVTSLALSSATFLLLLPALTLPFLTTSIVGVDRQSTIPSSVTAMVGNGYPELGVVIALFVIVFPMVRFGLLTSVLGALQLGRRPAWLGTAFRYANHLQIWAMADVFVLGLAVAYARLKATLAVDLGTGGMCMIAVAVLSLFVRATLDKRAVWEAIAADRDDTGDEPVLTCQDCELIVPTAMEGSQCPRCAVELRARKRAPIVRAIALTLAGVLLYIPANLYPMATLPIGLSSVQYTVLEGVIDLYDSHLLGLALLVFVASFAIPMLKLAAIVWCILSVVRGWTTRLQLKTRVYRIIDELGRWSMVDPFVIATFVPVSRFNALVYGRANVGAVAFTAVVILTIFAAHAFDPRRLWDVETKNG